MKMRVGTKRRVLFLAKLVFSVWLVFLLYLVLHLDSSSPQQHAILRRLMSNEDSVNVSQPLHALYSPELGTLSFYHLPLKQRGVMYSEITSANLDTSYPLAPDFTFHLRYTLEGVQLYEDHGPGCIHRIYLLPVLPTDSSVLYQMTSDDLTNAFLTFVVDNVEYRYSLKQVMEGNLWPFLQPFSTKHKMPASGMGSYLTMCYQESMMIWYYPSEKLPADLFATMVNCSQQDLYCPVHIYSAVSRTKYPTNSVVESFSPESKTLRDRTEHIAEVLKEPDSNGPDAEESCHLTCVEMCKGCKRTLFKASSGGVITAIKMRVFETATGTLRANWTDILLSAVFDNMLPHIDKVPLGSFFGATASLNEFRAAAFGKSKRYCAYDDRWLSLPTNEITGYFYVPMPYWRSVKITLEGSEFIDTSLMVCSEVTTENNYYSRSEAGYFSAHKTYYSGNVTGWREMLDLRGSWGHVVGVFMDVDNLRAIRNVPLNARWAALQSDVLVYVDDRKAASALGTGLEDYFSYAHGFAMAENTTYAFVGNYHSAPRQKEPLTWHVYRLHITDPIYFYHSIHMIMEGMSREHFQTRQPAISYIDHTTLKQAGQTCFSHLILYYSNTPSAATTTDILTLTRTISEQEHHFEILQGKHAGQIFNLANKRYLGAANQNKVYNVSGRSFGPGDKFSFTLTCLSTNNGVVLRRVFHSLPWRSWNEKAEVWVNQRYVGVWFVHMGALSDEYSLREDEFSISGYLTGDESRLNVTIAPLTVWRDVSYRALNIV